MPMLPADVRRLLLAVGLCLFVCAPPLLVVPAWAQAPASAEDGGSLDLGGDQVTGSSSEAGKVTEDAAQPASEAAFDPALVGLPGFPYEFATPAAFETALGLVQARLDELRADSDEARRAAADGTDAAEPRAPAAEGAEAAEDPRIEALLGLRRELQRDAALHERLEELRAALAEERRQISDPARPAVGGEPPYPITLLDQLRAERDARAVAENAAERRLDNTRRRLEEAVDALATAVTARRAARDRLLEARDRADQPGPSSPGLAELERELEARRLEQLSARRHQAAAQTRVALATAEQELAAAEQGLLDVKIEQIQDQVVLTEDMLDEQLAELAARAEHRRGELGRLRRMGETSESALYEAQRRRDDADGTVGDEALEALKVWVDARMAEVTAIRKGVEYVQQTLDDLAAMEQLWRRRNLDVDQIPRVLGVVDVGGWHRIHGAAAARPSEGARIVMSARRRAGFEAAGFMDAGRVPAIAQAVHGHLHDDFRAFSSGCGAFQPTPPTVGRNLSLPCAKTFIQT